MITITINDWRIGLQKVALTKLQVEFFNLGLKEAKENVDKLLDGEKIIIKTNDLSLAKEFISKAEQIGASCSISNDSEK